MAAGATEGLKVGEEIASRYVVEGQLGSGGMGAVYAARDTRLGRRVALKALATGDGSSVRTRQRLDTEARAVASIEHPGIVTLFDVVEHAGETVLVMELVAGESLRTLLASRALTLEEAANTIVELADALAAAHAKGLIHRDVKPDNVMVRSDGRIALLDFGVAKATSLEIDPFAPTTTGAGMIVGTPAYLAPEQARAEEVGPATDQFALAVVAHELLARELPWNATSGMALLSAILSSEPKSLGKEFPEAVSKVLKRALSKSPAERFPDIKEFATAFAESLGVSIASRSRSPSTSSQRTPHVALAIAPTLSEKAIVATKEIRTEIPKIIPKDSAPKRSIIPKVVIIVLVVFGAAAAWKLINRAQNNSQTSSHTFSLDDPAAALALADVPASPTKSESARAKFRQAMHEQAIGRGGTTVTSLLDAALVEDPDFASAELQRAMGSFRMSNGLDAGGRRAYSAALEHKSALGPRDAELLDAVGPSFVDPPDWSASATRLESFLARRTGDAQGWESLGILRLKLGQLDAADAALARMERADPNAYSSYFLRGYVRTNQGDLDGGLKLFAECVERVPTTVECRGASATIYRMLGNCAAADRVAREAVALAPDLPMPYALRVDAMAALGASNEAIADLMAQRRARMPPPSRAREAAMDELTLAKRRGDFPAALEAIDRVEKMSVDPKIEELAKWAELRAEIFWEIGDRKRSGEVAEAFLRRMAAYPTFEQPWQDKTGRLLGFAFAAGQISQSDYLKRRDAWIAAWHARLNEASWPVEGLRVVMNAYLTAGDPTPAEGKAAFEALAQFGRFDVKHPGSTMRELDPAIGALLLAAGRTDDAELRLGAAAAYCKAAPEVHAILLLGEARAKRGDTAGACSAFNEVRRYWKDAKPRSVTLEAANAAMKRERCKAD